MKQIPGEFVLSSGPGSVELRDKDKDEEPRRFSMVGYTGAAVDTFFGPMVFDLSGIAFQTQKVPILRQHNHEKVVGQSLAIDRTERGLELRGRLFDTAEADEVASLSDQGFQWQASVGLRFSDSVGGEVEFLDDGDAVEVNGSEFQGPGIVVRKSLLRESSFVPLGADSSTSAVALSGAAMATCGKELPMSSTQGAGDMAKRVSEFQAAFPDDPGFALRKIAEEGCSLEQAQAEYAQLQSQQKDEELNRLRVELEAKQAELEEAQRKASSPRQPIPASGTSAPSGASLSAKDRWGELVKAQLATGRNQWEATRAAALADPSLHCEYLQEINGGAALPRSLQGVK